MRQAGNANKQNVTRVEKKPKIVVVEQPAESAQETGPTVFVTNLDFTVAEEQLKEMFTSCGEVKEVRLPRGQRGQSKVYSTYIQCSTYWEMYRVRQGEFVLGSTCCCRVAVTYGLVVTLSLDGRESRL